MSITEQSFEAGHSPASFSDRHVATPELQDGVQPQEPEVERLIEPTLDDFDAQADYISMTMAQHENIADGLKAAHEAYDLNEPNQELKKFGRLMILARLAFREDEKASRLGDMKAARRRQGQDLSEEEADTWRKSVRVVCAYNQLLGSMVASHEKAMPRKRLVSWLGRAAGNKPVWAEHRVAGAATELAAGKLLQTVPGLTGVRHGDLDEDILGQDYIFDRVPKGYDFLDVKSNNSIGAQPVERDEKTGKLRLNIKPGYLDNTGYALKEDLLPGYRDALVRFLGL
jgi:hypothetical protein